MDYVALATDYDGTLATEGRVDDATIAALERLRESGRKLILVTGREYEDLLRVFDRTDLFDCIVAENGALLVRPAEKEIVELGEAPPPAFVATLRERGVEPLSVGHVIVATWEPNETTVLGAIRDLGLEHQVIFNKGAVMVLPPGVNKASGLKAAIDELGLSAHNVVGIGDAENDHALLQFCGFGVAVANALPTLRAEADLVTAGARGAGVTEIIDQIVADDLEALAPGPSRHQVVIGTDEDGEAVILPPRRASVLVCGTSGSGKSTLVTALIERLAERAYQLCVIDPEGDYNQLANAITVGDADHPPDLHEAVELLEQTRENVSINLLAVSLADRPRIFASILPSLLQLRAQQGRPHWVVIDEAHHMLPKGNHSAGATLPGEFGRLVFITVHPDKVSEVILNKVSMLIVLGQTPAETIRAFYERIGRAAPDGLDALEDLPPGEAIIVPCADGDARPRRFEVIETRGERRRHKRKYAKGELGEDLSFYFRGPDDRLNLRAHNLQLFLEMAEGVDDETWLFHLRQGDYSEWFREVIKDEELAREAAQIEETASNRAPDAAETRAQIRKAVEQRYTGSA